MASVWACLALVLLAANVASVSGGLGLGGLADSPAASPSASTADIKVPTDLCDTEFCLQAAPQACSGNCILTPLANQSTFCATACIGVWNSASVQTCLAGQATGVYIQEQLTAIADKCNAGAIAAARAKAAQTKYNTAFPCTTTVNATTLLELDTCPTGANATAATSCPTQCSGALTDIPATCRATFPKLSPVWNATIALCLTSAEGPATAVAGGVGAGANFLNGPSMAPSSGSSPGDQAAFASASPSAMLATALAVLLASALLA